MSHQTTAFTVDPINYFAIELLECIGIYLPTQDEINRVEDILYGLTEQFLTDLKHEKLLLH